MLRSGLQVRRHLIRHTKLNMGLKLKMREYALYTIEHMII